MKVTIWNVNGIRAAFRKQADHWWQQVQPDVLCLQEIRARPDQLSRSQLGSLAGWSAVWHPAQQAGYSGVACFCRQSPLAIKKGLGKPRFDREGRVIELIYPRFHLFNLYVPNGQRDLKRLDYKLDFYQTLLDRCQRLHEGGENIILGGDFNTAHRPIDLRNPKGNQGNTGFLPEERAWIDRFLESGFLDAFRELYPRRESYTWWSYRYNARRRDIGWRLDYFLVSRGLMERISDVIIHTEVEGSDHCPVTLIIEP